jgi:hypothetical protein
MQNLTGRFPAYLVPSSMSGGNTVADEPSLAMTAPGSPGIMPMPDVYDNLPLPRDSGTEIPVSHPGLRSKVTAEGSRPGMTAWHDAGSEDGNKGRWQETS